MPKTSLPAANLVTSVAALIAAQARSEPGWLDGAQPPPTRRHAYHGRRTESAGH
jgi:hypothetical protein